MDFKVDLFDNPGCDRCGTNDAIARLDGDPVCRACLLPEEYEAVAKAMREEWAADLETYAPNYGEYDLKHAAQQAEMLRGPIVNGEQFPLGYTPEAAAYEQRTR